MTAKLVRTPGPGMKMLTRLAELGRFSLEVGAMGPGGGPSPRYIDEHGKPGLPIATILFFHEFGLGVPRRSVIGATLASKRSELQQRAMVAAARVAGGVSPERALEQVGRWLGGAFVRRIEAGIAPPLSAETLARTPNRIARVPLLNTGQVRELVRSIRWVTVPG